eukprot:scaffold282915_cov28-Tisochrysis_lutea.AAC.1
MRVTTGVIVCAPVLDHSRRQPEGARRSSPPVVHRPSRDRSRQAGRWGLACAAPPLSSVACAPRLQERPQASPRAPERWRWGGSEGWMVVAPGQAASAVVLARGRTPRARACAPPSPPPP